MRTRSDLRGYQRRAENFMLRRRYGALLIDMGLGKTIIALSAIVRLLLSGEIKSVLLVGPIRVIEGVWRQEAKEWKHTRGLVFSLVHGSPEKRIEALHKPAHIYLINPEGLKWLRAIMRNRPWPWDMLLIDESTEFAQPNTVRFKALRRGLRYFKRRYIMTGTPTPRSLLQLWSQMYIVDSGASLGQRYSDYKANHFTRTGYMGYVFEPNEGAEETITESCSKRVVRLDAADWLELPKHDPIPIWIDLPPHAMRLYQQFEEEMFVDLFSEEEIIAESAATMSMKCRQIAGGAVYTRDIETGDRSWRAIHDAKINALQELVHETYGAPMLIAYQFKHDLTRIQSAFPHFKPFDKHRTEELLKKWNQGRIDGLMVHPKNTKYGLNMQNGGNIITWFNPTFSLLEFQQTVKRLARSGQKKPIVFNYMILARNTVDEVVLDTLQARDQSAVRVGNAFRRYYNRRYGYDYEDI